MKEKKHTKASSVQSQTKSNLSRRKFVMKSAGVIAAGSALGTIGATTGAFADVAPPEPESPDTSIRWKTPHGDLYNEKRGYSDRVVTGYKGKYIYGPTVGILQLPANIPMLPGDVGNPTTFNFPVIYELIRKSILSGCWQRSLIQS